MTRRGEETAPTGHVFGEWQTDLEPTLEAEGSRHRNCTVCGAEETETLPQLEPDPQNPTPGGEQGKEPDPQNPTPGGEQGKEPDPQIPTSGNTPDRKPDPGTSAPGKEPEKKPDETGEPGAPELPDDPEPVAHHAAWIQGLPDGTFGPEQPMSRAEAAVLVDRLLSQQEGDGEHVAWRLFLDVPRESWYAPAVDRMAELGVIQGVGQRRFEPERNVTRAEFAAMVVRAFAPEEASQEDVAGGFPDLPQDHWAAEELKSVIGLGWFAGDGDGLFRPEAPMTRAEGVQALCRILNRETDLRYAAQHPDTLRAFPDVPKGHWAWNAVTEAANDHCTMQTTDSGEIWSQ